MRLTSEPVKVPVLSYFELTEKEKAEYDYIETRQDKDDATFFRYGEAVYHIEEMMFFDPAMKPIIEGFHAVAWDAQTWFSGVIMKYDVDEYGKPDTANLLVADYTCEAAPEPFESLQPKPLMEDDIIKF